MYCWIFDFKEKGIVRNSWLNGCSVDSEPVTEQHWKQNNARAYLNNTQNKKNNHNKRKYQTQQKQRYTFKVVVVFHRIQKKYNDEKELRISWEEEKKRLKNTPVRIIFFFLLNSALSYVCNEFIIVHVYMHGERLFWFMIIVSESARTMVTAVAVTTILSCLLFVWIDSTIYIFIYLCFKLTGAEKER